MNAQYSLFDEIIVDNFAGGGGASTGIELATGKIVDIAINHDASAILMHKTNHPHTEHYQESVWDINPVEICRGRQVGLAWFSPDCKHFSKAKGAALVDRNIRGLAWIVLKWAGLVRPRVIILENVEEFVTWGPVRKGKPIKNKAGQTFEKWLLQLKSLGYEVEYKTLVAADYGTPTSRKRFFLVARCDGKPIVWPKPTHAPKDDIRVKTGELKPYRTAADIIDWSLPCPSIFDTKQEVMDKYGLKAVRPLADNTMRRIARGLDKFVIKNSRPFVVPIGYGERKGQAPRIHDIDSPLPTEVSSNKHYVCQPDMKKFMVSVNHSGDFRGQALDYTMPTVTAKNGLGIVNPQITPYQMHNHTNAGGTACDAPVNTITSVGAQMLITPVMVQHKFQNSAQDIQKPLSTVTAVGAHELIAPSLVQYHTEQSNKENRAYTINEPLKTADGSNRFGLNMPFLTKYYSGDSGHQADVPLHTVTSRERENLCVAHITEFKGQDKGQSADNPLRTITAGDGEFGVVKTTIVKIKGNQSLYNWPKVRELLNTHCGYNLKDDEILLFYIGIDFYFIADIGLRMLCPKELYAAMGFPADYIIDRDFLGNEYKRSAQVARCGNAVCPQLAKAIVASNLPEYCIGVDISSMSELVNMVAI